MKRTRQRKPAASSHRDTINTAHVASSPLRSPPLCPSPLSGIHSTRNASPLGSRGGSRSACRTRGTAAPERRSSHSLTPFPPNLPLRFLLSNSHSSSHLSPPASTTANNVHESATPSRTPGAARGGDPTMGYFPHKRRGGGLCPTPLFAPPGPRITSPRPRTYLQLQAKTTSRAARWLAASQPAREGKAACEIAYSCSPKETQLAWVIFSALCPRLPPAPLPLPAAPAPRSRTALCRLRPAASRHRRLD